MNVYRKVLASPHVASILVLGLLARVPFTCLGLLLTLHCVTTLDRSYWEAGLIVTASTVGQTISSPWRGRLVDRRGLRRALLPSVIVQPLTLAAGAFANYETLMVLVFVGGLFGIPVWSVVRTSLSVVVPAHLRRSAFSLDSVLTEVVFMTAPAAATIVATMWSTQLTMLVVAVLTFAAGVGLMVANPPTRSEHIVLPTKVPEGLAAGENAAMARGDGYAEGRVAERLTTGQIPVISDPATASRRSLFTLGILAVLVATGVGGSVLIATELSMVAILEELGAAHLVGLAMAATCAGSMIGGIAYGAGSRSIGPLWMLLVMGIVTFPIVFSSSVTLLLITVFIAGVAVAPLIAITGEAITQRVPEHARGEAMGWHGSALTVGSAAGAPLFGVVIDSAGVHAGIGAAAVTAIVVAALGLLAMAVRRIRLRRHLEQKFNAAGD